MDNKILFILPRLSYFLSHRKDFALFLREQGYEIIIACDCYENGEDQRYILEDLGLSAHHINISNNRINIVADILLMAHLCYCYLKYRPDIAHHVAIKPILYGSMIAKILRFVGLAPRKIINAVSGLGYVFSSDDKRAQKLRPLIIAWYQYFAKGKSHHIVVQNSDDARFFHEIIAVPDDNLHIIEGSGIDVQSPHQEPISPPIIVTCLSRLLYDKGIADLAQAAHLLHDKNIEIHLYGALSNEPQAISAEDIDVWQAQGVFHYKGLTTDPFATYKNAHIAILPSWREGMPKSLLEALACGLPIIACDVAGSRSLCINGDNGLLVPAKSPEKLAEAITILANNANLRQRMGQKSRDMIKKRFAHKIVNQQFLDIYKN